LYQDNSLLPREAVRLAALGILADSPKTYAALAAEVRNFASRIAGPSLDLMGTSIELLRHEGLIDPTDETEIAINDAVFNLTEAGRCELTRLLQAQVRAPLSDVSKLIVALKFRFMHLLPLADRKIQLAMMIEGCETELARYLDLRAQHHGEAGDLIEWLDQEIASIETRLDWLQAFSNNLVDNN
jgi:DNA-binding PadR family transcriptional regulator